MDKKQLRRKKRVRREGRGEKHSTLQRKTRKMGRYRRKTLTTLLQKGIRMEQEGARRKRLG
jgi:hypothetical protein